MHLTRSFTGRRHIWKCLLRSALSVVLDRCQLFCRSHGTAAWHLNTSHTCLCLQALPYRYCCYWRCDTFLHVAVGIDRTSKINRALRFWKRLMESLCRRGFQFGGGWWFYWAEWRYNNYVAAIEYCDLRINEVCILRMTWRRRFTGDRHSVKPIVMWSSSRRWQQ